MEKGLTPVHQDLDHQWVVLIDLFFHYLWSYFTIATKSKQEQGRDNLDQ